MLLNRMIGNIICQPFENEMTGKKNQLIKIYFITKKQDYETFSINDFVWIGIL